MDPAKYVAFFSDSYYHNFVTNVSEPYNLKYSMIHKIASVLNRLNKKQRKQLWSLIERSNKSWSPFMDFGEYGVIEEMIL